jgi:uncharacterized protein (DUF2252 family)
MSNVVERIRTFNLGRDHRLLQMKYKLMQHDVFAFYRGTCHLFYEDWPADSPLNDAPPVWVCGDLHLQNFGSYKGDNRLVYFDINDFDESVLAPCTWDLARLLVSMLIAAHAMKINEAKDLNLCKYFLDVYTDTLLKGRVRTVDDEDAVGLVKDLLDGVEKRQRKDFLDKRTTVQSDGTRKLLIDGKRYYVASEDDKAKVTALIDIWRANRANPQFYKVLDIAHRIAGIGSLGVERYVMLVEGKGSPHQNHLLDLKAEPSSSLQPYLKQRQPLWANQAERVVTIQRWIQAMPPASLAEVELNAKSFVLRELQPTEDKVDLQSSGATLPQLEQLMKTTAQVVAWGQLHSGGHQGSAIASEVMDYAKLPHWQKSLLSYAGYYAQKAAEDFREFCAACEKGML